MSRLAVYANLHRSKHGPDGRRRFVWSAKDPATGRVVAHLTEPATLRDVAARVGAAGRRRAQAEGRRNVHADLRGTPCDPAEAPPRRAGWPSTTPRSTARRPGTSGCAAPASPSSARPSRA